MWYYVEIVSFGVLSAIKSKGFIEPIRSNLYLNVYYFETMA